MLTEDEAEILYQFLDHAIIGEWPHVARSFCKAHGYTPGQLRRAWDALARMSDNDEQEAEDFDW